MILSRHPAFCVVWNQCNLMMGYGTGSLLTGCDIQEALSFFSEVDHIQPHDYDLRFQHRQNLQRLKHKLLRAAAMLDAIIDLMARVRKFLEQRGEEAVKQAIAVELEDFDAEAKYHRRCISDLRQRASDTMSLVRPNPNLFPSSSSSKPLN